MSIPNTITMIGVGGIGTAFLPVLARLRPKRLTLWDSDRVGRENLENQLYWGPKDIGKSKASCAAAWVSQSMTSVQAVATRYEGTTLFDDVVIAAVDSMESRRLIWQGVRSEGSTVQLLIDGRLSRDLPHFFQLFAIETDKPNVCEAYEGWLEGEGEPDSGRRDIDMIAAPLALCGVAASLLVRWSRGEHLPWQVMWDGLGMTLIPSEL